MNPQAPSFPASLFKNGSFRRRHRETIRHSNQPKIITVRTDRENPFAKEEYLISRLKQGDESAYIYLMETYKKRLFAIADGITLNHEESRDIVQDVFIKAFRGIHAFRGDKGLYSWLRKITINQCLNWKRTWIRRFRWRHDPIDKENAPENTKLATDVEETQNAYLEKELSMILWEKLEELPKDARAVLVLKEGEGLSYDEIAAMLSINKGTVSSRLFYARKRLKELLSGYMEGNEKP